MSVDVSVVIVAYRSARDLGRCLAAVPAACAPHVPEVLVVDNASPDDEAAVVAASSTSALLIRSGCNRGFAAGANLGLQRARGEFVVFVNPDAVAQPGSIAALVAAARRRPTHLLYGGRVLRPDGTLDPGCVMPLPNLRQHVAFASGMSTVARALGRSGPAELRGWNRDAERVVPAVSGSFVLAQRQDLLAAGGFDERYFMYSEDVELSARAHAIGRPPILVPEAVAVHRSGGSSSTADKTVMVLRGKVTYARERLGRGTGRMTTGLLLAGVALRAAGSLSGRGQQWRAVWRRRAEWRAGWGPQAPRN